MAALCRLCLSARGDTRPIFTSLALADRIRACVSIQLDEDDGYPTQICKKCLSNVNNWHAFKKICEDSQAKLRDWMTREDIAEQQLDVKIKNEPTSEDDDIVIDATYPGIESVEDVVRERLQPEGPPILASLGLAPRNEKESDDEYEMAPMLPPTLSTDGEHRPVPVEQLASKDCLVCGRAYRYSHNARRHERNAHSYDRYTNKIETNANNPTVRFKSIPNNYFDRESIMKMNHKSQSNEYAMKNQINFQNRPKPEILKSLLTSQNDDIPSDSEIQHSGYESPETEPDVSCQVEAIVTVPDTYYDSDASEDDKRRRRSVSGSDDDMDSDVEVGDCSQLDINRIIGIEQDVDEGADESNYQSVQDVCENVEVDDGNIDNVVEENIVETELYSEEVIPESSDNIGDDMQDDDDAVPPLMPIVEMNDSLQDNADSNDSDVDDASDSNRLTIVENTFDPNLKITSVQKAFLINYRDVIEQINTMKCKCCDRLFPRRKSVIQHLAKNGAKIPKHTCYTCVLPFTHIGALLSHMRYNCCNDTWKLIYREDGIPDSMIVDEPTAEVQDYSNDESYKSQYRDILNARSYSCKICSAKFQLKQFVMKHVQDAHETAASQASLSCFNCKYTFPDIRIWKKHMRNGACTVEICCDLCSSRFMTIQDFNEHAITDHVDQFQHVNQSNDPPPAPDTQTTCPLCKKSLSNYHNLVKHLKLVHNEESPHFCSYCPNKYKHVMDLQRHVDAKHSNKINGEVDTSIVKEEITGYNYSCTECLDVFETVDGWTEHQINVHHHIAHECDQCDKKFWDAGELEEHRNMHSKIKPFKCMLCANSYSSSKNLSEHINQAHQESISDRSYDSQFYCDICIRSFKSRQAFSNHMRIHAKVPTTNRRPGEVKRPEQYRSPNVPRQMPHLSMKAQIASQAPYSCDICGKGFLHKKNIWKHKKMLHPDIVSKTKENINAKVVKPIVNDDDDFMQDDQSTQYSTPQFDSFVSAAYDQPDQNSGSDSMLPYQCDLCDKKFAVKSSIWKHKRVKHGVMNLQPEPTPKPEPKQEDPDIARTSCTICKINFTDKKAYYRHRKNAHKVKICKVCGITFNTSIDLFKHMQISHAQEMSGFNGSQSKSPKNFRVVDVNNTSEDDDDDDSQSKEAKYSCDVCGKSFNEIHAIQNHVCFQRTPVSETYDCEICNKSYTSISALKSHRGWHLRSPDGRAAFSNSGLWMPQNKVTNKVSKHEVIEARAKAAAAAAAAAPMIPSPKEMSPMQIKRKLPPDVQVTVLKKTKLTDEVTLEPIPPRVDITPQARQVAISEDRYCEICNKVFTKKAAYQRHMDEVHKRNNVFCPICNKSFTRKSTLLVHMRKHDTGDISEPPDIEESDEDSNLDNARLQTYCCEICDVRLDSMKALKVHKMKQHSASSSNQFVSQRFQDAGTDGRVIEEGMIKEFKCSLCEEEWDTEQEVWNHHHFLCSLCGMYFSQHQYLVMHVQTIHANKEHTYFPCGKCNRSFMNKLSLQKHTENCH